MLKKALSSANDRYYIGSKSAPCPFGIAVVSRFSILFCPINQLPAPTQGGRRILWCGRRQPMAARPDVSMATDSGAVAASGRYALSAGCGELFQAGYKKLRCAHLSPPERLLVTAACHTSSLLPASFPVFFLFSLLRPCSL